jgi:hypothetical protein
MLVLGLGLLWTEGHLIPVTHHRGPALYNPSLWQKAAEVVAGAADVLSAVVPTPRGVQLGHLQCPYVPSSVHMYHGQS